MRLQYINYGGKKVKKMRKPKGKARILAVLLSACMLVQPVMGVYAAELPTMQEGGSAEQPDPSVTATTETTETPTPEASVEPTEGATGEENETPATEPTDTPEQNPSAEPTQEPEGSPSAEPTEDPAQEPTAIPSAEPTALPEGEPMDTPEISPSVSPEVSGNTDLVTSGDDNADSLMEVNLDMQSGTVNITLKEEVKKYLPCWFNIKLHTKDTSYDGKSILVHQNQEQVSDDMRYFINKSGTYYAGVSFYDIKTQMSYSVYSEEIQYTRPSKCLASPSEVKWDENIATWSPVDGAIGYRIGLYKVKNYTYELEYHNLEANTTNYDFGQTLNDHGNGSYYFTVMAVSANVTETANSEASGSDIKKMKWSATKYLCVMRVVRR